MSAIRVVWYRQEASVPLRNWLDLLTPRSQARCVASMALLALHGHELRRPLADYLKDDIHELRIRDGLLRLRLLYFFHGVGVAVITQGFGKSTAAVPQRKLRIARRSRDAYRGDPAAHRFLAGA